MTGGTRIVKMSGAGNDFVILGPEEALALGDGLADWIRQVCRRRFSVGADGVMVVEPSGPEKVKVAFFNPDGSAAFCGNGMRCAARFAALRGYAGDRMVLESRAGELSAELIGDRVRVVLPPPVDHGSRTIDLESERIRGQLVNSGVPHFVIVVDDVSTADLETWGPALRRHESFGPEGVNVDLVSLTDGGGLELRTWERGVEGETLSCGTGALAAALTATLAGADLSLTVLPRSGIPLGVTFSGSRDRIDAVVLEGDARLIFEGTVTPEGSKAERSGGTQ